MATHLAPIWFTQPEAGVYFEPAAVTLQANDRYPGTVLAFPSQTLKQGCGFQCVVPNNYVSAAFMDVIGATTATTGAVNHDLAYTSAAVGETIDPSTDAQTFANTTTTVPGTARLLFTVTFDLTDANLAAGDLFFGMLYRDAADAADTLAATYWAVYANLRYNDA
jgi:hypothetical protein